MHIFKKTITEISPSISDIIPITEDARFNNEPLNYYLGIMNKPEIKYWIPEWNILGDEEGCKQIVKLFNTSLTKTELGRNIKALATADLNPSTRKIGLFKDKYAGQLFICAQPFKVVSYPFCEDSVGVYSGRGPVRTPRDRFICLATKLPPGEVKLSFWHELAGHYFMDKMEALSGILTQLTTKEHKKLVNEYKIAEMNFEKFPPGSFRGKVGGYIANNLIDLPQKYRLELQAEEYFAHFMQFRGNENAFNKFCPPNIKKMWDDVIDRSRIKSTISLPAALQPSDASEAIDAKIPRQRKVDSKLCNINALPKNENLPLAKGLSNLGSFLAKTIKCLPLPIDIYCQYDPEKDHALWEALHQGTATFTVGLVECEAAAAVVNAPFAICLGLGVSAAHCAPDFGDIRERFPSDGQVMRECIEAKYSESEELFVRGYASLARGTLAFLEYAQSTLLSISPFTLGPKFDPFEGKETPAIIEKIYEICRAPLEDFKQFFKTKPLNLHKLNSPDNNSFLPSQFNREDLPLMSMEDVKQSCPGKEIQTDDIPTILEFPLQPECREELANKYITEISLSSNLNTSPAELVDCIEQLTPEHESATTSEVEVYLEAAEKVLSNHNKRMSQELQQAEKIADQKRKADLTKKMEVTFQSLNILGHAIVQWAEWSHRDNLHKERSSQARANFTHYMQQLGLDTKITEFYSKPLPDVVSMLRGKILEAEKESGNIWVTAVKEYTRQVDEAKERIASWKNMGENLEPSKKVINDLKESLLATQRAQDRYYRKKSKSLQKINAIASLAQIAGSVLKSFDGSVGTAVAGAAQLLSIGVGYAANKNEKTYQRRNSRLERKQQSLITLGQNYIQAKQTVQNQLTGWIERRRQQQAFLLQNPSSFQPHRYKLLLDSEMKEILNDRYPKELEKRNQSGEAFEKKSKELADLKNRLATLKSNTPHDQLKYRRRSNKQLKSVSGTVINADGSIANIMIKGDNCKTWQANYSVLLGLPAEITRLESELPALKAAYESDCITVVQTEEELAAFKLNQTELEAVFSLPSHLRPNSEKSTLEARLNSSNNYLKMVTSYQNSEDPALKRLWLDASEENLIFHAYQALKHLQEADEESVAGLLPKVISESVSRQPANETLLAIEKGIFQHEIENEKQAVEAIQKAESDEEKAKAEELCAPATDKRIEQQKRVTYIEENIRREDQILTASWDYLMQQPPQTRKKLCKEIDADLKITMLNDSIQQSVYKQLPRLFEIARVTDLELWQDVSDDNQTSLYEELLTSSKERSSRLKNVIGQQTNNNLFTSQLEKSLKFEEENTDLLIIDAYRRSGLKRLKQITGDKANEFENALLSQHQHFLGGVQSRGLIQQLPGLSSALESILNQLGRNSDWYKKKAIYGKLVTSVCSIASCLSYLYEAYHNAKEMVNKGRDKDPMMTVTSLLSKNPGVALGLYVHPLLGGISTVIEAINLCKTIWFGQGLPPSLEEQVRDIGKNLIVIGGSLSKDLEDAFTTLSTTLKKNHKVIEGQLQLAKTMLKEMEDLKQKEYAVNQNRRIDDACRTMRDQMNSRRDLLQVHGNPHALLSQFKKYLKECTRPDLTGLDQLQLVSLEEMANSPELFIGAIDSKLQKVEANIHELGSLPAPKAVIFLGKKFISWKELEFGNRLENSQILRDYCNNLLSMYQEVFPQIAKTALSLNNISQPFSQKRKSIPAISVENEICHQSLEHIKQHLKAMSRRFTFTRRVVTTLNTPLIGFNEKVDDTSDKLRKKLDRRKNFLFGTTLGLGATAVLCLGLFCDQRTFFRTMSTIGSITGAAFGTRQLRLTNMNQVQSAPVLSKVAHGIEKLKLSEILAKAQAIDPSINFQDYVSVEWIEKSGLPKIIAIGMSCIGTDKSPVQIHNQFETSEAEVQDSLIHINTLIPFSQKKPVHVRFYNDSQIKGIDIEAIDKISKRLDLDQWNNIEDRCSDLGEIFASTCKNTSENASDFKLWLGETRNIQPVLKGMVPIFLPELLIDAMDKKIAPIRLFFDRALEPKYSWEYDLEFNIHHLSIQYVDPQGKSYCTFPVFTFEGDALKSLEIRGNKVNDLLKEKAIACAQLIYLLYGEYRQLSLPSKNSYLLSSRIGYIVCDSKDNRGIYKKLGSLSAHSLHPVWSEHSKDLLQKITKLKNKFEKKIKSYSENYYLMTALLKLSFFDQKHLYPTLQFELDDCGFPHPGNLFDELCHKDCLPKEKDLMERCSQYAPSQQKDDLQSLLNNLR